MSQAFHSRIVERGKKEESPDVPKYHIGISNPKDFVISVVNKDDEMNFYVDDIYLGKYSVPIQKISELSISSWSHDNTSPVTVILDRIRILSDKNLDGGKSSIIKELSSDKWHEKWWVKYLLLPLTVGLILAYIIFKMDWNGNSGANTATHLSPTDQPTVQVIPTDSIIAPIPNDNFVSISKGEAYTDMESNIVVGLLDVSVNNKADISITIPNSETVTYNDVVPGKVYYFDSKNKNYSITVKAISFVGDFIEITITMKGF